MSYTQQEKQQALTLYNETGSIAKVINKLGYPTRQNMYTWIKNRNIEKKKKASVDYSDTPEHRRCPSLELKLSIIRRCFEDCYQRKIIHSKGKYEAITKVISQLFHKNDSRYGYRRIYALLKKQDIIISEKIVRRIMKENHLVVKIKKTKKYSSYMGEITKAAENLINRNFYSDRQSHKMLTDITEFSIPARKVYLSPIIDCFDGMVSAWKVGTNPNAELVNSMLDEYHETLKNEEKPIIHSDRGAHYRWQEWIGRMDRYGFKRSMSKKGCSPDNSACEGFFWKNEK